MQCTRPDLLKRGSARRAKRPGHCRAGSGWRVPSVRGKAALDAGGGARNLKWTHRSLNDLIGIQLPAVINRVLVELAPLSLRKPDGLHPQIRLEFWSEVQGGAAQSSGRKQQRLNSYLQGLLISGLTVLPYDGKAALWHREQRARLDARGLRPPFADGQIAAIAATQALVVVTRNSADFEAFEGLDVLNWFSHP